MVTIGWNPASSSGAEGEGKVYTGGERGGASELFTQSNSKVCRGSNIYNAIRVDTELELIFSGNGIPQGVDVFPKPG